MYSIHLDNCFGPAALNQLSKGMEHIISQESKQLRHYLYNYRNTDEYIFLLMWCML